MMKRQWLELSRRYQSALQKHLQRSPKSPARAARRLGRQVAALGGETLDLARMHRMAMAQMMPQGKSSAGRQEMVSRGIAFFAEAITPIEKTHRAGLEAAACLARKDKMLTRRTKQLAAANRHLKQGILARKTAEAALRRSGQDCARLLRESRQLHQHLQHLTHRILSGQEAERGKLSHDLQDEIAQTLLGINVRLLTLKKGAAAGRPIAKEIATTQRLVEQSVHTIDGLARAVGVRHET